MDGWTDGSRGPTSGRQKGSLWRNPWYPERATAAAVAFDSSREQQTRGAVPVGIEVGCKTDAATSA